MKDKLAIRIKVGDEIAFELFFRMYYIRLCAFSNKFLHDPEEAREVVHDVFTALWRGRKEIRPDESLVSYVFKITQNKSINRLRKKKVESKYIEMYKYIYLDKTEISPDESLIAQELSDSIINIIMKLPPQCKRIFELSRVEGMKYIEIADKLQISVKTVEVQISKALQILRNELKGHMR